MPGLPAWLDFSPQTFVGAAEAGQRLQQGQEQIGLERQRLAQSAAQAAAQLGMEGARLDQAAKENAIDHQVQMDQLQQNFLKDQQQQSVTKAYHDALIGLGQDKLKQAGQQHAAQIADTQAYWTDRQAGKSHGEAMAAHPFAKPVDPSSGASANTQSVTERFDKTDEVPADVSYPNRHFYNPVSWFFPGQGVTNTPAIPAHPAYSVTHRIPAGTPAQDYVASQSGSAPAAGAGSLPANTKQIVVRDRYNKKFYLPADQLKEATAQGYTLVPNES